MHEKLDATNDFSALAAREEDGTTEVNSGASVNPRYHGTHDGRIQTKILARFEHLPSGPPGAFKVELVRLSWSVRHAFFEFVIFVVAVPEVEVDRRPRTQPTFALHARTT